MSGNGFDLLKSDKRAVLLDGNDFAVSCILDNGTEEQGRGATLPQTDPEYDEEDSLKGVANFIGLTISSDNIALINDSSEICLDFQDIKIGTPTIKWTIEIEDINTGNFFKFKLKDIIRDRTVGVYRIKIEEINTYTKSGENLISRRGFGGS